MHTAVLIALVIVSLALVVVVLLQSSKSAGLSGAISGGAEQLFGKQKARGMDLILHRATIVLSILFFLLAIAIAKI
ncbi:MULTISPECIES: preprotein translocase subunit SecG [unclassified Lysinibacillus]|jgi:preprotein translocase subunit SecG|uniref:preprotein translocase subunit SecG n=1 Tax=unclassified Lysinibacillus TaxID=2636778 RepID=UPI001175C6AE|nr:preprotein translocase subunit SecG [Lysinibacillus sp. CD3-6]QPQ34415.1 preprotein translocase subunit SecG [Lysinibacillus sp. JNUCC-52]UED79625.1 preprotein translocase subunit SecG [Lysinibacillus sp. CD3-6]